MAQESCTIILPQFIAVCVISLTLTVTLKITKKENDTGMKSMKLNIELYLKVDFYFWVYTLWVYKRPIIGNGTQTHMDGPDF